MEKAVSAMVDANASDYPLLHVRLERANSDTESDRDGTLELLGALDAFSAGWIVPESVSFSVKSFALGEYLEESGSPNSPYWHLHAAGSPADLRVRPAFNNSRDISAGV